MQWLSLVHLLPRRVFPRAALHASLRVGYQVAADFHVAAGSQAADLRAAAASAAHRCPGVGSAAEAVAPGRRLLRASRIFLSQAQVDLEAWLRKQTLPAVGLNRALRIFLDRVRTDPEA
jgi:hypothetical protein